MFHKYIYLLIFVFLYSCSTIRNIEKKTVVLSVYNSSKSYQKWMKKKNRKINLVEAISCDNLDSLLQIADGILLTGGEDINPEIYGHPDYQKVCGTINHKRDSVEQVLFHYAYEKKMPLLGICRGMQMTNVALGGTLTPDIPTFIGTSVIHRSPGKTIHEVTINKKAPQIFNPELNKVEVNSNHHQCIDRLAEGLEIVAKTSDGVAEAVVYNSSLHPYIVAVQFHPERMKSECSKRIRNGFMKAISNK